MVISPLTDRGLLAGIRHGAGLLPRGLAALGALLAGRAEAARRLIGAGRGRVLPAVGATVLLGVLSLIPLGGGVLAVLRGALYGLVDHGPYDDSWGGPTRAGAWLAHAAVAVPLAVAALAVLAALAGLHRRLLARLDGRPAPGWAVPVTVLAVAAAAVLVVAWIRQV